jgi:transcriptional antiterminator RfaH
MNPVSVAMAQYPGAPSPGGWVVATPPATCAGDQVGAMPWYVVLTKVRQEQLARDNLVRQGFAVYLPRLKILKRLGGRQQAKLAPLFPRYLFVQPGSSAQSIAPVRSTLGVTGIVRFGQTPAILRAQTLCSLRAFEAEQNVAPDAAISPIQCGRRVRVAEGPLQGMEGLVSDIAQERVVILMNLLGEDTRVSLSLHQLHLAS